MHRGKIEQIVDLLEVVSRNPGKPQYRITWAAGLNPYRGNRLLKELLESKLITSSYDKRNNGKYVTITSEGMKWLQKMRQLTSVIHNGEE